MEKNTAKSDLKKHSPIDGKTQIKMERISWDSMWEDIF